MTNECDWPQRKRAVALGVVSVSLVLRVCPLVPKRGGTRATGLLTICPGWLTLRTLRTFATSNPQNPCQRIVTNFTRAGDYAIALCL